MKSRCKPITILFAEDDPDDRLLATEALEESHKSFNLRFVEDGEELMEYLYNKGEYADREKFPRPDLILLDLNMPKKDGRQALNEIKADPVLRTIPVVVLTTSNAREDIRGSYDGGANSYITKPMTFEGLVDLMQTLSEYWFDVVQLPPSSRNEHEKPCS
jgi:CheY-like chemotaxis protein